MIARVVHGRRPVVVHHCLRLTLLHVLLKQPTQLTSPVKPTGMCTRRGRSGLPGVVGNLLDCELRSRSSFCLEELSSTLSAPLMTTWIHCGNVFLLVRIIVFFLAFKVGADDLTCILSVSSVQRNPYYDVSLTLLRTYMPVPGAPQKYDVASERTGPVTSSGAKVASLRQ